MLYGILFILLSFTVKIQAKEEIDPNGYIVYCPCMGRFGNQADQFLGALAFAKAMNRTLVLPPWVTYPSRRPGTSFHVPFNSWFQVDPLKKYHKVVTMESFMKNQAPVIWPAINRIGFCYSFREEEKGCNMLDGNPFGPFWQNFKIKFTESVSHIGLLWSTDEENIKDWNVRFPSSDFPVLAFKGSPGSFPSLAQHHGLQRNLHFSKRLNKLADDYIQNEMEGKSYLAIHLRNGLDMTRVCDEIDNDKYKTLFSSAQCTELDGKPKLTSSMCNPPRKEVVQKVVHHIKTMKLKALFVATDNDPMLKEFKKALKSLKFPVSIHQLNHLDAQTEHDAPLIDIAIMSKADMFIGNCVSSFTAFVRRQRLTRGKPIDFFNIKANKPIHTEL